MDSRRGSREGRGSSRGGMRFPFLLLLPIGVFRGFTTGNDALYPVVIAPAWARAEHLTLDLGDAHTAGMQGENARLVIGRFDGRRVVLGHQPIRTGEGGGGPGGQKAGQVVVVRREGNAW